MPRVLLPLAALLSLLLVAEAGGGAGTAHTIRVNGDGWVVRIGELRPRTVDGGTLAAAMMVFGRPSSIDPVGNGAEACRVQWGTLRLRATFANFGAAGACEPRNGRLQLATIRSRRFRTWRNLRVGDRSSTIPEKHPNARFRRNSWWIASAESPFGDEATELPTVEALVSGGRVRILRLFVGSAGD